MLKLSKDGKISGSTTGSTKTDTLVKLVLIFFISLLSFSVGTFVGKQFSDSQYKMAQLEGNESEERDPASIDPSALEATPPDALTEDDIASLEEEFSKGKTVDTEKSESKTTAEDTTAHETANKVGHMVAKVAETAGHINKDAKEAKAVPAKKSDEKIAEIADKVLKGQDPTAHSKDEARAPSSTLPKTVANDVVGKFTVQVSAYSNEPDAVEHTKALKEKGFAAFYIPATIKGKTWFRVSIGLYGNSKEADDYRKKIIGQEIKSAIVQKIVQN